MIGRIPKSDGRAGCEGLKVEAGYATGRVAELKAGRPGRYSEPRREQRAWVGCWQTEVCNARGRRVPAKRYSLERVRHSALRRLGVKPDALQRRLVWR